MLLLLPVLTIPALIIGPPPARQLQLGLLVSMILAAAIVGVGVTALTWPWLVAAAGRGIGRIVHVVRPTVTPQGLADGLLAQRDRIAAAFRGHWWRAAFAAAANRMFDYAALVAALVAFGAHAPWACSPGRAGELPAALDPGGTVALTLVSEPK